MNSQAKPELVFQVPAGNFANQASENVHHEYNQAAPIHLPDSSDGEEQGNADNRKEGDDNGSQSGIAIDQFRKTEVKWFPGAPNLRM